MKHIATAAIVLCVGLSAPAFSATFTTFTDRAAFEAAILNEITEDFNSVASDQSFDGVSVDAGDFSLFADAQGTTTQNKIDAPTLEPTLSSIDGTALARFFLDNSSASISFEFGIYALGFEQFAFGNAAAGANSSMTILGESFLTDLSGAPSEQGFFGVISDTAFTQIDFSSNANDGFSIDNLIYTATPAAIPVPASLPLMIAALGSIGILRRKRGL